MPVAGSPVDSAVGDGGPELHDAPLLNCHRIAPVAAFIASIVPVAFMVQAKTTPFAELTAPMAE